MLGSWAGTPSWPVRRWKPPRSGALSRPRQKVLESSTLSLSRGSGTAAEETGMTIGKKLYTNFGIILTMVVVLFLVNWSAVQREHSAKAAAAASQELSDITNSVRSQMMQNRLSLSNYLLSGDTREVDRLNDGMRSLLEKLQAGQNLTTSEQQRTALEKVQTSEQNWAREFAGPLMDKRKEVDSGNATVAELQIFYLQKDASSWVKNASEYLDVADLENNKVLEARRKSDETAGTATFVIA